MLFAKDGSHEPPERVIGVATCCEATYMGVSRMNKVQFYIVVGLRPLSVYGTLGKKFEARIMRKFPKAR